MENLNRSLAKGRAEAFAALYDLVADRLFHYFVSQTGSREDAADLLQETFAKLFRSRKRLANVENLPAYVFRAGRNELNRWRSKHDRKQATTNILFELADPDSEPAYLDRVESAELITTALNRLPDHFREVVELKAYAAMTFGEISEIIEKPLGTVATWYRRALAEMRESLQRESNWEIKR